MVVCRQGAWISYTLSKLQDAAIIQDRMNRRMWERRPDGDRRSGDRRTDDKKKHQPLVDENHEEDHDSEDTLTDDEDMDIFEGDEATQEAYVAFQNAKSKWTEVSPSPKKIVSNQPRREATAPFATRRVTGTRIQNVRPIKEKLDRPHTPPMWCT